MTDITFTIDDAFYSQIVDAYSNFYDYPNHARLNPDSSIETKEDFTARMQFEEAKDRVLKYQKQLKIEKASSDFDTSTAALLSTQMVTIKKV